MNLRDHFFKNKPNRSELLTRLEHAVRHDEYSEQIALFIMLGDLFFDDAKNDNFSHWEPIVYSASIYNYALALIYNENISDLIFSTREKIYQIKVEFLHHMGISYPIRIKDDLIYVEERKLQLKKIRQEAKDSYKRNLSTIKEIYQTMGSSLDCFFIDLFQASIKIIDLTHLNPAPEHGICIAKMCSGANNRMHAYSDLDFLVFCQSADDKIFIQNFTLLAQLLILELRETPLRNTFIPGLEFMSTYYKYPKNTNGLKFDGRKSGAYPLDTADICVLGSFALVGTPTEMISEFIKHLECGLSGKHITSIKMLTTKNLWGNKILHDEYRQLLETRLLEKQNNSKMTLAQTVGLRLYERDIQNALFTLRDIYLFKYHLRNFEYVISTLGLYFHRFNSTPEEVTFWLVENNKISESDGSLLLKLFEWLKKIRLEMNIVNESSNLDLPILWNYKIYSKYYRQNPALLYFLSDLCNLTRLYWVVSNMATLKSGDLQNKQGSLGLELQFPTPVITILTYVSANIRRDNCDLCNFKVNDFYNNFPTTYLYPQYILDFFAREPFKEKIIFLEKFLHVGICIANHHLATGNHMAAYQLLQKLSEYFQRIIAFQSHQQCLINNNSVSLEKKYSDYLEMLVAINANLPTLLATMHYLVGRCYFYDPLKYQIEVSMSHLKIATIMRQLIDHRISKRAAISDVYNEYNIDSLLIERSGNLRLMLDRCDKKNLTALGIIKKKYLSLIEEHDDKINQIECNCVIIRIDSYLIAATTDPLERAKILALAEARVKELKSLVNTIKHYTFLQKIANVEAHLYVAANQPLRAQHVLGRIPETRNSFFNSPKTHQHIRDQEQLKMQLLLSSCPRSCL